MSGNHADILALFDPSEHEKMTTLIDTIASYHPKVSIDRDYQSSLRKSLFQALPEGKSTTIKISWYHWSMVTSYVCGGFLIGVGVWNFFPNIPTSDTTKSIATMRTPETLSDRDMTYSEEKALQFADTPAPTLTKVSHTPSLPTNLTTDTSLVVSEIADITEDILTPTTDQKNNTQSLSTASLAPMILSTPTLRETPNTNTDIASTARTSISSEIRELPPIAPPYPIEMSVYSKDTPWTASELTSKSASGMTKRVLPTEKSSIIDVRTRIETGLLPIISARIIYYPLEKIARDPSRTYYIVPVIEYTLTDNIKKYIPIIRGYR